MVFRNILLILGFCLAAANVAGQVSVHVGPGTGASFPRFEDYPATKVFHGKPVKPIFLRNRDRLRDQDKFFRTKIADGAAKGPNFAGHYTVVEWGCGKNCVEFLIADAISGRIYFHTGSVFSPLMVPDQGAASGRQYAGLEYQPDSSLLIADGCAEAPNPKCETRYYRWEKNRLVMLASVSVPPAPQPYISRALWPQE